MLPPPIDRPKTKIPFTLLLEFGLLHPGTSAAGWAKRNTQPACWEDGTLVCGAHRGSIHKVCALLLGKPSCNGWENWYYQDKATGEMRVLDTLREEMRRLMEMPNEQLSE